MAATAWPGLIQWHLDRALGLNLQWLPLDTPWYFQAEGPVQWPHWTRP
jgi:hypothetical protein